MSNSPLQSHSMAAFTCSCPAVSHHLLLCVDKFSDSGVANLSLFLCSSRELGSVNVSIFDRRCGEFTFSWNWFWITKARYKVVQQEIFLNWSNHDAENDFRTRSEKFWLWLCDHVCFVIFEGLYSRHYQYIILSTYPLFWNNYVNLPIFSSDNMKSNLSVLLWSILTGDASTCDVR